MGCSNEAWSRGRGRGEGIVDNRRTGRPCDKCGSRDRCGVRYDPPSFIVCYRVASGEHTADGGFIHRLDATSAAALPVVALAPSVERAPPDVLDRAYRAMTSQLGLLQRDGAGLLARGIDAQAIERAGYASLEVAGRAKLGRAIVEAVGEDLAARVPGYVVRSSEGRSWPSVAGWPGLLVPCRDERGRILGCRFAATSPATARGTSGFPLDRRAARALRPSRTSR